MQPCIALRSNGSGERNELIKTGKTVQAKLAEQNASVEKRGGKYGAGNMNEKTWRKLNPEKNFVKKINLSKVFKTGRTPFIFVASAKKRAKSTGTYSNV